MYKKIIFFVVILFLSVNFVVASENMTFENEIVYVDGDNFLSIEDAIDDSRDNGIIELNGTYKGESYIVNVNKDITIQGSGDGAILDAENGNDAFYFNNCNVTLKNLRFVNVPYSCSAVKISDNACLTIINCSFDNVGIGIAVEGTSLQVDRCSFNKVSMNSIFSDSTNTFVNNSIFTNHEIGIFALNTNLTVENSIFKNAEWADIDVSESGDVYIRKSKFLNSDDDAYSARILSNKSVVSECIFSNVGSLSVFGVADILNCNFTNAHASLIDSININVKNSNFLKNSYLFCGNVLNEANIINNIFEADMFKESNLNKVKVINNTVKGNLVYFKEDVGKFNIKNSQFLNNYVGKNMFVVNSNKITIHSNVFSNNTCTYIFNTEFSEKSSLQVTNNVFSGNFNKKGELVQIKAILYSEEYGRSYNNYYTVVYTSLNVTNNFLGFNLLNKYELTAIPQVQHHDTSWINVAFKQISSVNGTYTYSLSFVNPKGDVVKLPTYSFKIKDKKTNSILVDNIWIKSGTATFTYDKKLTLDDIYILTGAGCIVNRPKVTMTIKRVGSSYDLGSADIILSYQNSPFVNQLVYVEIYKHSRSDLIDGYRFKTNSKGIVDVRELLNVASGPYIVKAQYASKDFAYATATIKDVKVTPNSVVVKTSKVVTTYKSGKTLNIKVVNSKTKKPVKNCIVSVVTNYGKYSNYDSGATDSKGWAHVDVSRYKIGTFKIVVSPDDGNHKCKSIKTTIKIMKAKCSVSVPKNVKKSSNIQITLKNKATKKPNSAIKVKVKVFSGKSYKTYNLKTNSKGIIKINTKKLSLGKHQLVISSNDGRYSFSKKSTVKIEK